MSELIPIGTVNRTPTENNKPKATPSGVEHTLRSKNLADEDQHPTLDRRRKANRRHNRAERRQVNKTMSRLGRDRRKKPDRRARLGVEKKKEPEAQKRKASPEKNKGLIIDERI
jgi:hypothetical protein